MRSAEAVVARRQFRSPLPQLDAILHMLLGPLTFLMLGIESKIKLVSAWAFLAFGFLTIASYAMPSELDSPSRAAIFYACQFIPALFLVFALPSAFALRGVSESGVDDVAKVVRSVARSGPQRAALADAIAVYQGRSEARATSLKWLLGIIWGGVSWYASHTVFDSAFPDSSRGDALGTIAVFLVVLGCAALMVQGYASSVRILFQTVSLAFAACEYSDADSNSEQRGQEATF